MRWLILVIAAAGCGGNASPEQIARFVRQWRGTTTAQLTCGTQQQVPIAESVSIALERGSDADLQYTSAGGCSFKFHVDGNTATLSNGPVKCATAGINFTFTEYAVTITDSTHLSLNAAGGVVNGSGACKFNITGSLCSAAPDVCDPPPPPATALELVSGGDQTRTVGSTISISVRARAADGTPVPGVGITAVVESGGGSAPTPFTTTGSDGVASIVWTLGTDARDPQSLLVRSIGGAEVRVAATVVAGPATALTISSDPPDIILAGTAQLTATPRDAYGNVAVAEGRVSWGCTDPGVIAVSETGVATGVALGSAQITASMGNLGAVSFYSVEGLLSGSGTASIDGTVASGEWDHATTTPLLVNVPGGTTPGRLYVMNDDRDLYLAVTFARPSIDAVSELSFNFDTNGDGLNTTGDDQIAVDAAATFSDRFSNGLCPGCFEFDVAANGTTDGAGIVRNDGTLTVYELRHPLDSGDPHDVALTHGSRIGIRMGLGLQPAGGVFQVTWLLGELKYLKVTIR